MSKEKENSAYEGSTTRAKSRAGAKAPIPPYAVSEAPASRQRGRTVETTRAVEVTQKSVEGRSRTVETRRRSAASKPPVKGANRIADEANAQDSNVEDPRAVEATKKSGGRPKKNNKPKIIEVIEVSSREVTPEPLGPATNRPIAWRAENKRAKSRRRPVFPPKRLVVPSDYNEMTILDVMKSRIDGNGVNVLPSILPNSTQLAPSSTEDSNSHDVKDEEPVAETVDGQNGKEDEIRNTEKEKEAEEGSQKGEEETNDRDSSFNNPKSQSDPEDVIPLSPTEQAQRNQNTEEEKKVDEESNGVQNLRQMENHHDKSPHDPIKAKANIRTEEEREKEMIRLGMFLSDSEEEAEEPVIVEEEANGRGGDQENNRLSPTGAAPEKTEEKEDVQEPQSKRRRA